MGVTKEKTLQQSDGLDQLNNNVGNITSGDIVTIRYKGWYIDTKKNNKRREFDDMFHSEKKIHFTVDKKDTPDVLLRGLHDAVKLLVLGEKAISLPSLGNYRHFLLCSVRVCVAD